MGGDVEPARREPMGYTASPEQILINLEWNRLVFLFAVTKLPLCCLKLCWGTSIDIPMTVCVSIGLVQNGKGRYCTMVYLLSKHGSFSIDLKALPK